VDLLRTSLASALLILLCAPPIQAKADRSQRFEDLPHAVDLSVHGSIYLVPLPFAAGGGLTAGFPIKPRGLSKKVNDAFYIELDVNVGWNWFSGWTFGNAGAGVRYQRFLSNRIAPYVALKGGALALWPGKNGGYIDLAGGAVLPVKGGPFGFRIGASFWILLGTDFHVPVFGRLDLGAQLEF